MSEERAEYQEWLRRNPDEQDSLSIWQAAYAAGKRAGDRELMDALRSTVMFVPLGHPLQELASRLLALHAKEEQ